VLGNQLVSNQCSGEVENLQTSLQNQEEVYKKELEDFIKLYESYSGDSGGEGGSRKMSAESGGTGNKLQRKVTLKGDASQTEVDSIFDDMVVRKADREWTTETYYCTKRGQIKGIFRLKGHVLTFDPLKCIENESVVIFESQQ